MANLETTRQQNTSTSDRELNFTRLLNAPRELVFKAWTDPKHVTKWWGPNGFTTTTHEMDVRPGGVWRFMMHGPDGTDYPNKIVYEEMVVPERLVYSHGDDNREHFKVTILFEIEGNKTKLTMKSIFPSAAIRDQVVKEFGAAEGAKQTLKKLANYLEEM